MSDLLRRIHEAREALSKAGRQEAAAFSVMHYGGPEERARHADALENFRAAQRKVADIQAEHDAAARQANDAITEALPHA